MNFVRSAGADTSKEGELILAGSTNTTQTSHTEKTTTAGVYQEMSGHGETKQTYNQTQINGKVNIATGINTTVVIPEGDLKNQIEALSQQPGMAYIGELAKDPRVNWLSGPSFWNPLDVFLAAPVGLSTLNTQVPILSTIKAGVDASKQEPKK